MARYRTVKPEFWSSGQVMACSRDARLLFIGLWNFSDDAGRHSADPKQIKAQVLPGDDDATADMVQRLLDELARNDLLRFYEVDGKRYLYITGWHHQKIDKPQKPKHPAPFDDNSSNDRQLVATERENREERIERKGERDAHARALVFLPEDWKPSSAALTRAKALGLTVADLDKMLLRFGPHYRARGEKRADWDEQFLAWCADEAKKLDRSPPQPPKPPAPTAPIDPLWAPIREHLLAAVGEDVFTSWLKGATVVSLEGEELILGGPSKFIVSYWINSLYEKIGDAITAAYPHIKSFKFVVSPPSERKTT